MKSEAHEFDTIIIGGGLAGLAIGLRRKAKKEKVLILEKNRVLGGKLTTLEWEGFKWDKGPSLFTSPELLDELFKNFEKNPRDYYDYQTVDETCRYFFNNKESFILYSDSKKRKEVLTNFFSAEEAENVEEYLNKAAKDYNGIGKLFIDQPKFKTLDFLKLKLVNKYPQLLSKKVLGTLNQFNESKFDNYQLINIFNRFGTYNGSNPYEMSGLYSMIAHLELNTGTHFPVGGMRTIIDALEKLATEEGLEIEKGAENIRVKPASKGYIVTYNDQQINTKNIVSAIDYQQFFREVLPDPGQIKSLSKRDFSSSAVVFYWALNRTFNKIGLHNILFGADYQKEFEEIFEQQIIPTDPTIYIHKSAAVEKGHAPENCENWFVMINTPPGIEPSTEQLAKLRNAVFGKITKHFSVNIKEHILKEFSWTKSGIEEDTGSLYGSLYGLSSNHKLAAFKRPGNSSKKYKNLFFCGGTVHPGGGIPLVLKSAKITDTLMNND